MEKEKILEILQEAFDYEQEEQRGPRIRLHTEAGIRNFICRTFAILNIETGKSGL